MAIENETEAAASGVSEPEETPSAASAETTVPGEPSPTPPEEAIADADVDEGVAEDSAAEAVVAEVEAEELAVEAVAVEAVAEELAVEAVVAEAVAEELAVEAVAVEAVAEELVVEAVVAEVVAEELAVEAVAAEASGDDSSAEELAAEAVAAEVVAEDLAVEAVVAEVVAEDLAVEAVVAEVVAEDLAVEAVVAEDLAVDAAAGGVSAVADEVAADAGDATSGAPVVRDAMEPADLSRPDPGERPAITAPTDIGDVADELSADDFAEAIDRTVFDFKEGDIVAGTVVRVDPDEALIDIGYKSEGVVPANELSIRNSANPADVVAVGDQIEALVMQKEDESGRLVLSKKRAQYERAWGRIERVMNEGGTVNGPVIEVVKGGLIVDIGLRGFLPASLVDLRRVRDLHPFVGEIIEAKVIELDRNRNNVVLSRRAYLEEAQAEQRQAFLSDLQPGDVRDGTVSSVVNFGAFVDLGGMDGLVHVSELSWQHVSHPSEIVTVGDKVKVRVLEVDRDRERISLSIRQTQEDPWDTFAREIEPGSIIDGKVTKTVPFGAFVSVGDGVEGLVHVSEIAIHHVDSPELELSIGQPVKVKVTEIDADRRRVSLSIKQALPEWEERSQWTERRRETPETPRRREFQREEEATEAAPSFNADASLEAILQELKERGIGRK